MMQEIGDEMQAATGALCQNNRSEDGVGILDLCMAPGGYTASALNVAAHPTWRDISHLLHKIEALDTMELLYLFSQFSDIEVFKPLRKHAIRSTFYLIAKNVQPSVESARVAVIAWKKAWWNATFGGEQGVGAQRLDKDDKYAQAIIDSFGDRLTTLARPVWKIQADALSRTDFTQ
ncbi:hypothetical protein V501_00165 [Pseudogymnoascus sp. VKM F-4519 (FW-2642)]|nr:hypothetical protein V501_00165 [Pseudogymnoascus sp. VKM F-4519 (FW-2642)]